MIDKRKHPQKNLKDDNEHYEENGKNFKAGTEESGTLPNNPAKNKEHTSPEDDQKKDKRNKTD